MQKRRNKNLGDWGEDQAVKFLQRQDFVLVGRNYFTPVGEIDIIARKGNDFYFIEVKTRQSGVLANDLAITPSKMRRFNKAVSVYCYKENLTDVAIIKAGLIVTVNKIAKSLVFRFFVIRE